MIIHMEEIITLESLYLAWRRFRSGKRRRPDVLRFEHYIEENLRSLHKDIVTGEYKHGEYIIFSVCDRKRRSIAKASVRDRVVHEMLYNYLTEYFENIFIHHSYSSRKGKGCVKARAAFRCLLNKKSRNYTSDVWIMKIDARKFFNSVDHNALVGILFTYQIPTEVMSVLLEVLRSYNSGENNKGIPLGNVTSQVLANVYMNEFDIFVVKNLKFRNYIRYNDDCVLVSADKAELINMYNEIRGGCMRRLKMEIKLEYIRKLSYGVDFLGFNFFPKSVILRRQTYKKIIRNMHVVHKKFETGQVDFDTYMAIKNSYSGLTGQADGVKLPIAN